MSIDFDSENAPKDGVEIDISGSAVEEIKVEGRFIEVVDGPDEDPFGTLLVKLVGSGSAYRTFTRLEIGWEHAMQVVSVKKTGSTVTRVRVWK